MALIDQCRRELRIQTTTLDEDILLHIAAAKEELIRAGVPAGITEDSGNNLVTRAIRTYVHAYMGHDDTMEQYQNAFEMQEEALRKSFAEDD